MKIVIAPDKFKNALDALAVADAIGTGIGDALEASVRADCGPWSIEYCALADGGEGSGALICFALGGRECNARVKDALGRAIVAKWWNDAPRTTGIVEAAEAIGLWRVAERERDPLRASSYGVGQLIRAAVDDGAKRIILCVGGTATVDGGAGCLQALGWTLRDATGCQIPAPLGGGQLARIHSIEPPSANDSATAGTRELQIEVCADVRNPLLGPEGAVAIFAPQKGARTRAQLQVLEHGMVHWAAVLERFGGRDVAPTPGAGAAGGLPAALLAAFSKAEIVTGAARIAQLQRLDERLVGADLCFTGEGRLDAQTGFGKVVAYVAQRCRLAGVPVVALVGAAVPPPRCTVADLARDFGLERIVEISPSDLPLPDAIKQTREYLRKAAATAIAGWLATRPAQRGRYVR